MALKPKLIADYAARWLNGRPPDALCVEGLKIAHGFTKNAAERFLRVYDDAIWRVRGGATAVRSAKPNLSSSTLPAVSVRIGDYVQWSADGVDQYAAPRKVVWLLDGGRYVCVEGSQTRLSAAEVRVVAPPSGLASHPRQVLLANGDWAGRNGNGPKILQLGDRLQINADLDLEGVRKLEEMLRHYREILLLSLPKTENTTELVVDASQSEGSTAPAAGALEEQDRRAPFPVANLMRSFIHARFLYNQVGRAAVTLDEAASAWELDPESSEHLKTVESVFDFGLIEQSGSGTARKICISELGWRMVGHPDKEVRLDTISEVARTPKMFADYAARWRDGRPEDETCIAALVSEHGFTEKMAAEFIWLFDDTIPYMRSGSKVPIQDSNIPGPDTPESPVLVVEPEERNKLAVVQRGCRLEIVADLDLEGLDKLGETLNGYQKILQLWAPEKP